MSVLSAYLKPAELHTPMPSTKQFARILICIIFWLVVLGEAATRTYYIGILEEYWDYAPTGKDLITGKNLTEEK